MQSTDKYWRNDMNGYDKIPEERKQQLDALFEAFSIIGDDTYVYLCDMQYDFSRWSKVLTDDFGLPGEYMYGAGERSVISCAWRVDTLHGIGRRKEYTEDFPRFYNQRQSVL